MKNKKPKGALLTASIRTHGEAYEVEQDRAEFRKQYPDATIRTFHRDVRADGLMFPVHIVTVRARA